MARSSYVYVASQAGCSPTAGFTVKHELVAWLKRQSEPYLYAVWRIPDGMFPGRKPAEMDVRELVGDSGAEQ